jgi:integrase
MDLEFVSTARAFAAPRALASSRYHLHESAVHRTVTEAARRAVITKRVTCHTFRYLFTAHLLEIGYESAPSRSY